MDRYVEQLHRILEHHTRPGVPSVFSFGTFCYVAMVGRPSLYSIQDVANIYRDFMTTKCPYMVCLKFSINHDKMRLHILSTARDVIGWIEEPTSFHTLYFFKNHVDACVFKLTFG